MHWQRESSAHSLPALLTLFGTADIEIHLCLAHAQLLTVERVEAVETVEKCKKCTQRG